jgi:biotin carboxyl carrier protein
MEANHKDTEFIFNNKKIILKRGQLICGRTALSMELGISENKIYRMMSLMQNEQLIEQQKTNAFTLVSITSYTEYQDNEQQNEQPVDSHQTASRQPVDTSKELIRTKKKSERAKTVFKAPSVEDVQRYCMERGNSIDAEQFVEHYTTSGWMRGKAKIQDWKACVRTWEIRDRVKAKDVPAGEEVMDGFRP